MQIIEHIDVVDWERSVFDRHEIGPGNVFYSFDKLVLRKPDRGLPPLFRISANEGMLLVSAEARSALESAGIRGVTFKRLRGA